MIVAGTVLSVALFVVEPEAVMGLVLRLVKSRHVRSHQTRYPSIADTSLCFGSWQVCVTYHVERVRVLPSKGVVICG